MNKLILMLNNPSITNNRMGKISIKLSEEPKVVDLKNKLDNIELNLKEIKYGLEKLKKLYND